MRKVIGLLLLIFIILISFPVSTKAISFPNEQQKFDYVFGKDVPFEISYEVHEYRGIGNLLLVLFGIFSFLSIFFFQNHKLSALFITLSLVSLFVSGLFTYIF